MYSYFKPSSEAYIASLLSKRAGEVKLGECIATVRDGNWQETLQNSNASFVLLGIPEDIGVRANYGAGGTYTLWEPALKALLTIQSTKNLHGRELLLLGHFDFSDWMQSSVNADVAALRTLVARIDEEVSKVAAEIIGAGKIPIVIGGGHNNAFPLLQAAANVYGKAVNCINCDAHSDYRVMEGRHSGNGFRYARHAGYLERYAICGLHENYNSAAIIADMKNDDHILYFMFEDIFLRQQLTFSEGLERATRFVAGNKTGVEIDLDCIENTLSSAITPSGITTLQARQYIYECAQRLDVAYLHIAEGAVALDDGRRDNTTAKLVAYLVSDFMKSRAYPPAGDYGHD